MADKKIYNLHIRNVYTRIGITLMSLFMLLLEAGCFVRHPDTCEVSVCELSENEEKTPSKQLDTTLSPGETKEVEICACKSNNKSNIRVNSGEKYIFQVHKITECWKDGTIQANPHDGWSGLNNKIFGFLISPIKRSSEASWYALVGSVEAKTARYTFSPLNYHGYCRNGETSGAEEDLNMDCIFTVKQGIKDAELYFYANDAEGRYFNNKGMLTLKITRLNLRYNHD